MQNGNKSLENSKKLLLYSASNDLKNGKNKQLFMTKYIQLLRLAYINWNKAIKTPKPYKIYSALQLQQMWKHRWNPYGQGSFWFSLPVIKNYTSVVLPVRTYLSILLCRYFSKNIRIRYIQYVEKFLKKEEECVNIDTHFLLLNNGMKGYLYVVKVIFF